MDTLLSKLVRGVKELAGWVLTPGDVHEIVTALENRRISFKVPIRVRCRLSSQGCDVSEFWCPSCGFLYGHNDAFANFLRCPNCGAQLVQAYIFTSYFYQKPLRSPQMGDVIRSIVDDPNARCPRFKGETKRLIRADINRPVESLSWACPFNDIDCEYRSSFRVRGAHLCLYDETKTGSQKKSEDIVRVKLPSWLRPSMLGTRLSYSYTPTPLTEAITKPITLSIYSYKEDEATELDFSSKLFSGIERIFFVEKLEAFQFTLGLAVGYPSAPLRYRASTIIREAEYGGRERVVIFARQLVTEGLIFQLSENVVKDLLADDDALFLHHSFAHALLKYLPLMTGLSPQEFFEAFSVPDREVVVYDNAVGGIGGVRAVLENSRELRFDFQEHVAEVAKEDYCPLGCTWACRACLFTENCGRLNRQLRRGLLERVLSAPS